MILAEPLLVADYTEITKRLDIIITLFSRLIKYADVLIACLFVFFMCAVLYHLLMGFARSY